MCKSENYNGKMILTVLIVCFCIFSVYGQNPILRTNNGHLIIETFDRNITLKSNGYININEDNLIHLLSKTKEETKYIEDFRTYQWNLLEDTLGQMKRDLEGSNGIKSRLRRIEFSDNSRNVSLSAPQSVVRIRRKLNILSRRISIVANNLATLQRRLIFNECKSTPCLNGGTCFDGYQSFTCRCPDNWKGETCQEDVNECREYAGSDLGCQNGATCINLPGTYQCVCTKDWHGIHCTIKEELCKAETSRQLCGHGVCVPHVGLLHSYTCICDQGWTQQDSLTPACTKDVNECESATPHCSTNPMVPCINVPGSFYCGQCPQGYSGNGYYCTDIDECLTDNGGCSKNPKVQCINTMGSRICFPCPSGYVGDGVVCTYQGVCHINNGGCHPQARCQENPAISATFVQCICPPGLTGNGMGPMGCTPTSITPATMIAHPCSAPNRCNGRGSCSVINSPPGFICHCAPPYSGINCESSQDPCLSSPCQNGGTCIRRRNGYFCRCTSNSTGAYCQQPRQSCGGYLRQESGRLVFPTSNSKYSNNVNCAWVIATNASLVINVTFTSFNFEPSDACLYDWLQIHNGERASDPLINKYCGNRLPNNGTIVSSHNALYLWVHTDASRVHDGFSLNWTSVPPVCGGTIEIKSHGALSSPGSPGNYPNNRDCEWTVVAPISKRIQFHFMTMQLQPHPNCSLDYFSIYDNYFENKALLRKYCGTLHPEPLVTSGHSARLVFHTDSSITAPGFHMTFIVISGSDCGGILTAPSGEIAIPLEKENIYKKGLICEWKIQMPANERIQLFFKQFQIENSRRCVHDNLEVYDGSDRDSPLKGKYCGKNVPLPIESSSNLLYIRFKSDYSLSAGNIIMYYQTRCGGVYSEPSGILESPFYPNYYPNNRICEYQIEQPIGKIIRLEFQDFDLESLRFSTCRFDYLEIYDGLKVEKKKKGRYCGRRIPPPVISSLNSLTLVFTSDISSQRRGFLANYTTETISCGGVYKDTKGSITFSPFSEVNSKCEWIIVAKEGFVIQLNIHFINGLGIPDSTCTRNYFDIYDNNTNTNTDILMGRFCSKHGDQTFTSHGNVVSIFGSDATYAATGFQADYQMIDQRTLCGGRYTTPYGVISSPGYPKRYPRNKDCAYLIHIESGKQLVLLNEVFDLEYSENCNYDYLEIRNGGSALSPLIGKFCQRNMPPRIPSMSNQLYLRFVSDYSGAGKGFRLSWESSATGCGGTLTAPSGEIMSPHYPQNYPPNIVCYYKIRVNPGNRIKLVFVDFDVSLCEYNYLEVRDGKDKSGILIGKYCEKTPLLITSQTNSLYIKFQTNHFVEGRGFHIKYDIECKLELTGHQGVIESPNYPFTYPPTTECVWKIMAPKGNLLNITISHFSLNQEESLELSETIFNAKENDKTVLIKRITKPEKITTTKATGIVNLKASDSLELTRMGFRLEWIVHGCGGEFKAPFGGFSTPGYPNSYPEDLHCLWYITADYDHSIELTIVESFLEIGSTCDQDYLDGIKIYSALDEKSPPIAYICHRIKSPLIYVSSGNEMLVKFFSDRSFAGKGFLAHYRTVPRLCGGLTTAPTGIIMSRNYPKNYEPKTDCSWLIRVENHYRVKLEFLDFDLDGESDENCNKTDWVRVYDGPTTSSSYTSFCGNKLPNDSSIYTTSNEMLVVFHSDEKSSAKGFRASYHVACGRIIQTDTNGKISVEDYLIRMDENLNCSWIISAKDPSDHVALTVTHVHVGPNALNNQTCNFYEINIHEGDSSSGPLLSHFCGTKAPRQIITQGSVMFIEAKGYHVGVFQAVYSVLSAACGGDLSSEEGSFASPDYPNSYPANVECIWKLKTSPGNRIQLNFDSFNLQFSENCNQDYLEIRKNGPIGSLIGAYCENPPNNIIVDTEVWIKFRSDNDTDRGAGFFANYKMVHGNEINGTSGKIGSPLYPNPYMQEGEYTWRIQVEFGKFIRITFIEFYIGSYSTVDCGGSLTVFDGYDKTAPSILTACGANIPDPIESSSNVLLIQLQNVLIFEGTKFLLKYNEFVKDNTLLVTKDSGCSETIYLSSYGKVNISSPGFPHGYSTSLECIWTVEAPPGYHVTLVIETLDLEFSHECSFDYIAITDSKRRSNVWSAERRFCEKNATIEYLELLNMAKIKFVSDFSGNRTGFSGYIMAECGDEISETEGEIVINNSTNLVWSSKRKVRFHCEWIILVRPSRQITFIVDSIYLPKVLGETCDLNYLILRNGGFPDSPYLGEGKFCGSKIPTNIPITTSNRAVVIVDGSKDITIKMRFQEFAIPCGETIHLDPHIRSAVNISSPNFPNIPNAFTECVWVITGPPGESLRIDFIERFDFAPSIKCSQESVTLREGATDESPLIKQFCKRMPDTQRTKDNHLYIKYVTKLHDPHNGFKATVSIESCGGTYYGLGGVITSPLYPGYYESRENCTWNIIVPLERKVTFTVAVFEMNIIADYNERECQNHTHLEVDEAIPAVSSNSLPNWSRRWIIPNTMLRRGLQRFPRSQIDEGFMGTSGVQKTSMISPITSLCSKSIQNSKSTISSSTNQPRIILKVPRTFETMNQEPTEIKFKINYSSQYIHCGGGLLTGSEGIIQSYNYPSSNLHRHFCHWRISVPSGRRIKLEFLDIDLNDEFEFNSFIRVYDSWFSLIIGMVTKNSQVGQVIYSSANEMSISFWTIKLEGLRGFKLKYSSEEPSVCEGSLDESEGKIFSPNKNYNLSTYSCQWTRNNDLTQNQTIVFKVTNMTSNATDPCEIRPLRIRSGYKGKMYFRTICLNENHYTSFPQINFMAMNRGINLSFVVEYSIKDCGGVMTSPGIITSPGYPNKYPPNMICVWIINFAYFETVKATFTSMNLEQLCNKDRVIVHNGDTLNSPILGQYCGNAIPVPLNSSSSRMLIEFHSDGDSEFKGFEINIDSANSECGGLITSVYKKISSPNFPNKYPALSECVWEIRVDQGYSIRLSFVERFNIEMSTNCTADYVEIFDYVDGESKSIKRLCGREVTDSISSTGNQMRIVFRSNSEISGDGFKIKWSKECNTIIHAKQSGDIFSPGYPDNYLSRMRCNYTLIAPPNSPIQITTKKFSLEKSTGCTYDNLTIIGQQMYWGTKQEVQLGPFCGQEIDPLQILYDRITFMFISDRLVTSTGFHLHYELFVCGGIITEPTIIRSSVSNESTYMSNLNCSWHIEAPHGKIISLHFKKFHIEFQDECFYDELKVVENNITRGIFCGNLSNEMPKLTSKSNTLDITFKSDHSREEGGFYIKVDFTYGPTSGCGGDFYIKSDGTKTIVSPDINGDGFYEPFLVCDWTITTDPGYVVHVDIVEMDLNNCTNSTDPCCDYLEFFTGAILTSEQIVKLCDNKKETVISSSNELSIRFHSDKESRKKGFKANIKAKPSICGNLELTASNEIKYLTSPNYPEPYPDNIFCRWHIAQAHKLISIHFLDFDLEDGTTCETDNLRIEHKLVRGMMQSYMIRDLQRNEPIKTENQNIHSNGLYCGSRLPPNFYEQFNADIYLRSGNNKSKKHKGFKLSYTIADCITNYTQPAGSITYGNMDENRSIKECTITIETPKNTTISLFFQYFMVGTDFDCEQSYLQVRDGLKLNSPELAKICGFNSPRSIFSTGNTLRLYTRAAGPTQIMATYISSTNGQGCGGYIREISGIFTSPLYPSNYRKQNICSWTIESPIGLIPVLKFEEFDMGARTFCETDFVEIFFVNSDNEETLKTKYCGTDIPAIIIGRTNKVIVRQTISLNNAGVGWRIKFITVRPNTRVEDIMMRI